MIIASFIKFCALQIAFMWIWFHQNTLSSSPLHLTKLSFSELLTPILTSNVIGEWIDAESLFNGDWVWLMNYGDILTLLLRGVGSYPFFHLTTANDYEIWFTMWFTSLMEDWIAIKQKDMVMIVLNCFVSL